MRTSFWLAAWLVFVFGVRGLPGVAVGLAAGSALSIFSLWTLTWAVTRALNPERRRTWLLGLMLLLKLPVYAVVLQYALSVRGVSPFAVLAGLALVPTVIVLKAVSRAMLGYGRQPSVPGGALREDIGTPDAHDARSQDRTGDRASCPRENTVN